MGPVWDSFGIVLGPVCNGFGIGLRLVWNRLETGLGPKAKTKIGLEPEFQLPSFSP